MTGAALFPVALSAAEVDAVAAAYRDAVRHGRVTADRWRSIAAAAGWRLHYVGGQVRVWHAANPDDWRWAP